MADGGQALAAAGARVLATVLDNGAAFVALDEAALQHGIVHVPLPQFFSAVQMQHALQAAGVDTLLVAAAAGRRLAGAELVAGRRGRRVADAGAAAGGRGGDAGAHREDHASPPAPPARPRACA